MPPLPDEVISALPEGYRDHPIVKEAADVASVVKQAIDGQKELGNRIRVPGPDASPEDRAAWVKELQAKANGVTVIPGEGATDEMRAAFYESIGRPKEAKLYSIEKIQLPDGLPDDFKIPADLLDKAREVAFKDNLTQAQFESGLVRYLESEAFQVKQTSEQTAERDAKLKEQFGAAEDAKKNAALRAAEKFGGKEFADRLAQSGTPEEWAAWAQAGETFAESGSLDITNRGASTTALSPDEATRRISEINANRDHAYHKNTRPGHKDAVFEMFNLTRQRMGERPLTRSQYDAQFDPYKGKFSSTQLGSTVAEVGG